VGVTERVLTVADAGAMEAVGARLAPLLRAGDRVFFSGDLGAGKTTLIRGILRGLGYTGPVKSPTFTLVESYTVAGLEFYHFDLYRLEDPEELETIGIRDYMDGHGVCLVEWPERGRNMLGVPDVEVVITIQDSGRGLRLSGRTDRGQHALAEL
jgi:tRNA threonylcarbamoyladenosine biosynthesis protein TsaE